MVGRSNDSKQTILYGWPRIANSEDPDQTAPLGAV